MPLQQFILMKFYQVLVFSIPLQTVYCIDCFTVIIVPLCCKLNPHLGFPNEIHTGGAAWDRGRGQALITQPKTGIYFKTNRYLAKSLIYL